MVLLPPSASLDSFDDVDTVTEAIGNLRLHATKACASEGTSE
jgi:hypothetical protein